MMKEEFEARIKGKVDNKDYVAIEMVYAHHPSINCNTGKDQMATLYTQYGIRVIRDMVPTAEKARDIEEKLMHLRNRIDELKAEYEELKR